MLMQTALQSIAPDVEIKTLLDGEDLLPQLHTTELPNLVLLDLNMARTGGFEALVNLRSTGQYGRLPIVVLTTSSNPADRLRSEVLGANDFHTKPDNFRDLSQLARLLINQWLPMVTA